MSSRSADEVLELIVHAFRLVDGREWLTRAKVQAVLDEVGLDPRHLNPVQLPPHVVEAIRAIPEGDEGESVDLARRMFAEHFDELVKESWPPGIWHELESHLTGLGRLLYNYYVRQDPPRPVVTIDGERFKAEWVRNARGDVKRDPEGNRIVKPLLDSRSRVIRADQEWMSGWEHLVDFFGFLQQHAVTERSLQRDPAGLERDAADTVGQHDVGARDDTVAHHEAGGPDTTVAEHRIERSPQEPDVERTDVDVDIPSLD